MSTESPTPSPSRPDLRTWAEIDFRALHHNLDTVQQTIGPQAGIAAVIKANAYGHGLVPVAQSLAPRVSLLAVATLEEAVAIRKLHSEILLLSPCIPAERAAAAREKVIVTVSGAQEAAAYPAPVRVNLKVDTGMGRIGCTADAAERELAALQKLPGVEVHSISTHLPSADEDADFTRAQLEQFRQLCARLRPLAGGAKFHALNSAGILEFPEFAADFVRAGLILYGSASPRSHQNRLRPVLTWKTRITLVRDVPAGRTVSYGRTFQTQRPSQIASLAVGYADGFPRQASGQGAEVLIGGIRCPVIGRVTMDQILADVSAVPSAQPGDEAVLIGRQGTEEIFAAELAEKANTIAWDLFTGLGSRVKRLPN